MMDRFLASLCAGALVFMVALDAGLPAWRHLPIGDASDLGAAAAFAVWFCLKAQAIEAQRAETVQQGSVADESAVGDSRCAQTAPKGAI